MRTPLQDKAQGVVCPDGTQPGEEVIASSGITFHLWRLYQHAWLVCLFFPFVSLVREPLSLWHLISGLLALLFFAASYTWLMWPHPASQGAQARARSRFSLLLFVALSLQVALFSLVVGPAWIWLFIGVSAIAGVLLPMRSAIRELHTARRELARLKVDEERLRLARDLHDLLGQTLSLITLKSELARDLVREEPERCAQEISEIERVARESLREVREAVAGYRQPRLEGELEGARQLLEAAGINYQIEPNTLILPPETSAVLAWTVREGVTNVIRHSRARHCEITLIQGNGTVGAAVINDGGREARAESPSGRPGLGLAGLW